MKKIMKLSEKFRKLEESRGLKAPKTYEILIIGKNKYYKLLKDKYDPTLSEIQDIFEKFNCNNEEKKWFLDKETTEDIVPVEFLPAKVERLEGKIDQLTQKIEQLLPPQSQDSSTQEKAGERVVKSALDKKTSPAGKP